MSKRAITVKSTKGQSSSSQETIEERVHNFGVFGVSLRAFIPTYFPDLNGRLSSGSTNRCTVNWFVSSLPPFRSGLLLTKGGEIGTELAFRNAMMVRDEHKLLEFWLMIRNGEFTTRSMVVRMIWDPRPRDQEMGQYVCGVPNGHAWRGTASGELDDHTSSQIVDPAWSFMSRAVPSVSPASPSTLPNGPASPLDLCP
nr:hypothetical protein [Tanacetum cinerariifolium]